VIGAGRRAPEISLLTDSEVEARAPIAGPTVIPVALAGSDSNPRGCCRTLLLASLRVPRLLRAPPAAGPIVLAARHRRPGYHDGTPARRGSGGCGPAMLPAGRAGHFHTVTAGVAVPALPPAARRRPDARMPLHGRSSSTSVRPFPASADRHFSNAGRASGTVPGHCATALADAHLPIASWRIVRHPARGPASGPAAREPRTQVTPTQARAGAAVPGAVTRRMRSADGPPRGRSSGPRRAP